MTEGDSLNYFLLKFSVEANTWLNIYLVRLTPAPLTSVNDEESGSVSDAASAVLAALLRRLRRPRHDITWVAPPTHSLSHHTSATGTAILPPSKPPRSNVSKKSQLLLSAADCSRPLAVFSSSHEWISAPAGAHRRALNFGNDYPILKSYSLAPIFGTLLGNLQWPTLSCNFGGITGSFVLEAHAFA